MTTDLKHTPGPWAAGSESKWTVDTGGGNTFIHVGPVDADPVCIVIQAHSWVSDDAIIDANAALIAAAPKMLEALIEAEVRLRYSGDRFHDVGATDRAEADWAAADKARAAIAKAGG